MISVFISLMSTLIIIMNNVFHVSEGLLISHCLDNRKDQEQSLGPLSAFLAHLCNYIGALAFLAESLSHLSRREGHNYRRELMKT